MSYQKGNFQREIQVSQIFTAATKSLEGFLLILLGKVAVLVRTSVPQLLIWNTGSSVRSLLKGTVSVSELHTSIPSGCPNNLPVPFILWGGDGLC